MLDVLCGVLLLAVGYLIGKRERIKPIAQQLTEEEIRAEKKAKEQWEQLLSFSGKGGVTDER